MARLVENNPKPVISHPIFKSIQFKILTAIGVASAAVVIPVASSATLPSAWFDACILRPVKCPAGRYEVSEVDGVKYSDVFFPSVDGAILHGWLFQQPGATRMVLLSHGIGGNVETRCDLVQLYLRAGTNVFIYDYEGYGRSQGKASLRNIVDDGYAAYTYLTQHLKVEPRDIVLAGESLGTGVTCGLSKRVKAAAIILQSPFSSLARRVAEVVPLFQSHPSLLAPSTGLDNDAVLSSPHPPVLIVHGGLDQTVPVWHAYDLYDHAVGPKQLLVIPNAGHTGDPALMFSAKYLSTVTEFLKRLPRAPQIGAHVDPSKAASQMQ